MKERILRVLMILAFLFAVGFTIYIAVIQIRAVAIAAGIGASVIAVTSMIQYILISEWHPMYLFKNSEK